MTALIPERKDGTVPLEDQVRRILRAAMKTKNRVAIAQAMTRILGRSVTASMLADFTRNGNGKRQVRFPAAWVGPFCEATGNDELARCPLPDALGATLGIGQKVAQSLELLRQAVAEVEKLAKGQTQKKPRPCKRVNR